MGFQQKVKEGQRKVEKTFSECRPGRPREGGRSEKSGVGRADAEPDGGEGGHSGPGPGEGKTVFRRFV